MKLLAAALVTLVVATDFTGVWEYRQKNGDGFDRRGERLEIRGGAGGLTGVYHGLERMGEHGLYFSLVEVEDLKLSPDGVTFTVPARALYRRRPATLARAARQESDGHTRDELAMTGRLEAGRLVLRCAAPPGACPDEVMVFQKGRWRDR